MTDQRFDWAKYELLEGVTTAFIRDSFVYIKSSFIYVDVCFGGRHYF
jgi:hypothetical protein